MHAHLSVLFHLATVVFHLVSVIFHLVTHYFTFPHVISIEQLLSPYIFNGQFCTVLLNLEIVNLLPTENILGS